MPLSAYVANANSNNVSVVDTVAFTVTTNVTVGNNPRGVAVTPDLTKVYVTNFTDNTVSVINALTNTVTTTIPVGTGPNGIAVTPDGTKVLTANNGSGSVTVISVATNTVIGTITLNIHGGISTAPWALCISPDSTTAYVVTEQNPTADGYVEFCNIAALTNPTSVLSNNSNSPSIIRNVQGICVSPDGLHVYCCGRNSGLNDVISTVSHTVVASMTDLTGEPSSICILPDGSKGFWNNSTGRIYPFNPATFTPSSPVVLLANDIMAGIAPTSDSSLVFSADEGPAPTLSSSILWKVNSTTPTINSQLSTFQNQAAGVGLSYYPVPPPPTPAYPGATFIPKLFIPIKGKVSVDYTAAELMANWIAIEIWSQRWKPLPPVALFIPRKNSTRSSDLDANWFVMETWVNQINQAEKAPFPTLFIPRKSTNHPTDLDVDFLRIQDWANGIAHG